MTDVSVPTLFCVSERVWVRLVFLPVMDHLHPFIAKPFRKNGVKLGVHTCMLIPHIVSLEQTLEKQAT